MFHFSLFNIPLTLHISSEIIETIFSEISTRNPIPQNGTINIIFVGDDEMQTLNRQYREKDATTDVLSFHYFENFENLGVDDVAGEILLCESKVFTQSEEFEHTPEAEIYKLITHGILHIVGYDHETDSEYEVMHPKEIEVTNMLRAKHQIKIVD